MSSSNADGQGDATDIVSNQHNLAPMWTTTLLLVPVYWMYKNLGPVGEGPMVVYQPTVNRPNLTPQNRTKNPFFDVAVNVVVVVVVAVGIVLIVVVVVVIVVVFCRLVAGWLSVGCGLAVGQLWVGCGLVVGWLLVGCWLIIGPLLVGCWPQLDPQF